MTELLLLSCPEISPYITTNPSGRVTSKGSVRINWTVALVGVMELISTLLGIPGAKASVKMYQLSWPGINCGVGPAAYKLH